MHTLRFSAAENICGTDQHGGQRSSESGLCICAGNPPLIAAAVAHVHEDATDKWWRFDDETVTLMPDGPIGETADHGIAANPAAIGIKVTGTLQTVNYLPASLAAWKSPVYASMKGWTGDFHETAPAGQSVGHPHPL